SAHLGRSASAKLARVDHRRSAGLGALVGLVPSDVLGGRTVARLAGDAELRHARFPVRHLFGDADASIGRVAVNAVGVPATGLETPVLWASRRLYEGGAAGNEARVGAQVREGQQRKLASVPAREPVELHMVGAGEK